MSSTFFNTLSEYLRVFFLLRKGKEKRGEEAAAQAPMATLQERQSSIYDLHSRMTLFFIYFTCLFVFFYRSCLSRFGFANKTEQRNEPQTKSKCGDIRDREHNAFQQGPILQERQRERLFQLITLFFCVTGISPDTPSSRNDNLYISRCAGFFQGGSLQKSTCLSLQRLCRLSLNETKASLNES